MKRLLAVITCLILIIGLCACGGKTENSANQTSPNAEVSTAAKGETASSDYPLTVTDDLGTQMTLAKKPVNIVSLTLGADEVLFSIVEKSRIKGITYFADDPGISNITAQAKDFPTKLYADNAEKIIALQPDLVIIDTYAKKEFVQQLRDAGIPVYQYEPPFNIDQNKRIILSIARLVGEKEKGEELVSWMDNKLKEVSDRVSKLKPEERLTVLDYSEMGTTSGKNTNFDDLVTRAGLINAAAKAGLEGWPQISKEKIVEINPDIIMVPAWVYDKNKSTQSIIDSLKGDKSLAGVKAIKNNRIIAPNYAHLSSVSQYAVLAVEDIAKAAYPELFK